MPGAGGSEGELLTLQLAHGLSKVLSGCDTEGADELVIVMPSPAKSRQRTRAQGLAGLGQAAGMVKSRTVFAGQRRRLRCV